MVHSISRLTQHNSDLGFRLLIVAGLVLASSCVGPEVPQTPLSMTEKIALLYASMVKLDPKPAKEKRLPYISL